MVEGVNRGDPVCRETVAQGQGRVVEVVGLNRDVAKGEASLDQIMVADRRPELLKLKGKVRVLHLPRKRFAQRGAEAAGRIDVPLIARPEKGSEEGQTLDVIPVSVADQDMATHRVA